MGWYCKRGRGLGVGIMFGIEKGKGNMVGM
jgi:hypothetical protein